MATVEVIQLLGEDPAGDIDAELDQVFAIAPFALGHSQSTCGCPSCFSGGFPACCC